MFAILSTSVYAAFLDEVGNQFRSMLNDGGFLYFFFYVLIMLILYAVFNAAGKAIPMFSDEKDQKMRKVFAITVSLLVTTVMFINYRGSLVDMVLTTMGPSGKPILLFIGIVFLAIILYFLFSKTSGAGGTGTAAGGVFKWIIYGLIAIVAIWLLISMFSGGGGSAGGNPGDWIALIIGLALFGIMIFLIIKGLAGGASGGYVGSSVGGGGDAPASNSLWGRFKQWVGDQLFGRPGEPGKPSSGEISDRVKSYKKEKVNNMDFKYSENDFDEEYRR